MFRYFGFLLLIASTAAREFVTKAPKANGAVVVDTNPCTCPTTEFVINQDSLDLAGHFTAAFQQGCILANPDVTSGTDLADIRTAILAAGLPSTTQLRTDGVSIWRQSRQQHHTTFCTPLTKP
jgi:hypothetical protein